LLVIQQEVRGDPADRPSMLDSNHYLFPGENSTGNIGWSALGVDNTIIVTIIKGRDHLTVFRTHCKSSIGICGGGCINTGDKLQFSSLVVTTMTI
jgi:hypothetical protein